MPLSPVRSLQRGSRPIGPVYKDTERAANKLKKDGYDREAGALALQAAQQKLAGGGSNITSAESNREERDGIEMAQSGLTRERADAAFRADAAEKGLTVEATGAQLTARKGLYERMRSGITPEMKGEAAKLGITESGFAKASASATQNRLTRPAPASGGAAPVGGRPPLTQDVDTGDGNVVSISTGAGLLARANRDRVAQGKDPIGVSGTATENNPQIAGAPTPASPTYTPIPTTKGAAPSLGTLTRPTADTALPTRETAPRTFAERDAVMKSAMAASADGTSARTRQDVVDEANKARIAEGKIPFDDSIYGEMSKVDVANRDKARVDMKLKDQAQRKAITTGLNRSTLPDITDLGSELASPLGPVLPGRTLQRGFVGPPAPAVPTPPTTLTRPASTPAAGRLNVTFAPSPLAAHIAGREAGNTRNAKLLADAEEVSRKKKEGIPDFAPSLGSGSGVNRLYKSIVARYTK